MGESPRQKPPWAEKAGELREAFNQAAESYDAWYSHPQGKSVLRVEAQALDTVLPTESVGLEVGGGTGAFARLLSQERTIICLDPSPEMLRRAATNQPTILAAGERLPLRPQSLGFVYLATTLEFIQNPREALLEAHTALRPGGTLATLTINPRSSWGRLYLERAQSGDTLFQHATLLSLETVTALHQEAGFQPHDAFGTLASHPWDTQVKGGRHPPDRRCGVLVVHSTKTT